MCREEFDKVTPNRDNSRMSRALPVQLAFVAFALCFSLHICAQLPHEAYVWQRHWTPALDAAVDAGKTIFAGYRVNAGDAGSHGGIVPSSPHYASLANAQLPVVAVLRLHSVAPPDWPNIRYYVHQIADYWPQQGIQLTAIEIDYDCATAKLDEYAQALAELRRDLPRDLRLSITALPAWMDAPQLDDVLAQVDQSTLQVHAVRDPAAGLFDAGIAWRWIQKYSRRSATPFRVALPAYGVRASFDEHGRAIGIEAEVPRILDGAYVQELAAAPEAVSALLHTLNAAPPPNLVGVVWYRLPSADDMRSWSFDTLRAVIAGAPLTARVSVRDEPSTAGAHDLVLSNTGTLDAAAPTVRIDGSACSTADGVNGFTATASSTGWRFAPAPETKLRAARELRVGWARCGNVENVGIEGGG